VAEAVSFLSSGGIDRSEMDDERIERWQQGIMEVMFSFESVFEHIADEEVARAL